MVCTKLLWTSRLAYFAVKASKRKKHTHAHTHRRVEFSAIGRLAALERYMQIVSRGRVGH